MQIRRSSCFICNFQGRRVSKTVRRALRLLLLFDADDKRELSVTEAAREMSIDKSVASRLLSTLASEGFLQRNLGTQSYKLGPTIIRLGAVAQKTINLITLASPHLVRMRNLSKETVSLQVWRGNKRFCVYQVESQHDIRRVFEIDVPMPLEHGSSGAVLLAFAPRANADAVIGQLIRDREEQRAFLSQLEKVRRKGYAISSDQAILGISGISAPLLNASGEAVASITISGPTERWTPERIESIRSDLLAVAAFLSEALGATPSSV